jgi:hypothetical protein
MNNNVMQKRNIERRLILLIETVKQQIRHVKTHTTFMRFLPILILLMASEKMFSQSSGAKNPVTMIIFGHRLVPIPGYTMGDTWDGAWLSNDKLYLQHNDGTGFNNAAFVHDRLCEMKGTPENILSISGTNLNPGILGNLFGDSTQYSTAIYEVDSILYHLINYSIQIPGAWQSMHCSILKSMDGGKNWYNHLGQLNRVPPNDSDSCFFKDQRWVWVNFVKYGKGGDAPDIDNAKTYVYLYGLPYMARVKRTDLPLLDLSKYQYYTGGDGMNDSCWSTDPSKMAPIKSNASALFTITYNNALGRYIMTTFKSDSWLKPPIQSSLQCLESPKPWGPWSVILDENVNYKEGDNLCWTFLQAKFTSADGKKMWQSISGRDPYGLQFMPIYLTTNPVDTFQAENASLSGLQITSDVNGYTGTGFVTGFDSVSDNCKFNVTADSAGIYMLNIRYHTNDSMQILNWYVNNIFQGTLKIGKSEQIYATWTNLSFFAYLPVGKNTISFQPHQRFIGDVGLDELSVALYSTSLKAITGNDTPKLPPGIDLKNSKADCVLSYPNPTNGNIYFDKEYLNIDIINIHGEPEMTFKNAGNIDVSVLPAGIYFLKIYDGIETVTKSVFKE